MLDETKSQRNLGEVKLLLNEGKLELNQATVPVRWAFDGKALESAPTHLLFIDQKIVGKDYYREGARTLCSVEEATQYLQLLWDGEHHITVFAFHLSRNDIDAFEESAIKDGHGIFSSLHGGYYLTVGEESQWVVAKGEFSCIVPQTLFATRPKSAFGKALWDYCHMFSKKKAKDQCEYRALKLKMIPLVPILGVLFVLMKIALFLGGAGNALIAVVYWLVVALSGFRPESLTEGVREAFVFGRTPKEGMYDGYDGGGYRYLGKFGDSEKEWVWWITPFEAIAVAFLFFGAGLSLNVWLYWILLSISMSVLLVLLVRFGILGRKGITPADIRERKKAREEQAALREAEEEARYKEWLKDHYAKLNGIPDAYSGKEKATRFFRLGFWALKAKVCKPFSM